MTPDDADAGHSLACPFWIDTDAYTDRDRHLFVCGYEFHQLLHCIRNPGTGRLFTFHRENESRVRMACGRFGRECVIRHPPAALDPAGTWAFLTLDRLGDSRAWEPGSDWRDDEFGPPAGDTPGD